MRSPQRQQVLALVATVSVAVVLSTIPAQAAIRTTPGSTEPPASDPIEPPTIDLTERPTADVTEPPAENPSDDDGSAGDDAPTDPEQAYQAALKGAQTVAVAEAQQLLTRVLGEQAAAQRTVAKASTAAEEARRAEELARQELKVAEESAARTQRQIDEITTRSESTRNTLGAVAREAYQGHGLAALGVVLAAATPAELTDRYAGMRTLMQHGDSALGQIAEDQAELRNASARLEAQREQLAQQAAEARETRLTKEAAEQAALHAQSVLESKSELVQSALQAAEDAKLEDYTRYMEMLDESTAISERLADIDYGPGYGTGTFVRPGTGRITSEYGQRLHPILGYVKVHTGLDFGRGDGSIYAADSGTVIEATWNNAYGNMVILDHGTVDGQRLTTMYAHQADLVVTPGQQVERGQVIGNIGSTGYSTGAHLHFEVRVDGRHTDPWSWVEDAPLPR